MDPFERRNMLGPGNKEVLVRVAKSLACLNELAAWLARERGNWSSLLRLNSNVGILKNFIFCFSATI